MAATVIGRGQELDAIEAFLREAELGPRALVLSGEAGIGKTALWEAGVDEARSRSASVLTCRGVELEASLSFAGLSELVMPVFEEIAPALLPPRRRARSSPLNAQDACATGVARKVRASHGPVSERSRAIYSLGHLDRRGIRGDHAPRARTAAVEPNTDRTDARQDPRRPGSCRRSGHLRV